MVWTYQENQEMFLKRKNNELIQELEESHINNYVRYRNTKKVQNK